MKAHTRDTWDGFPSWVRAPDSRHRLLAARFLPGFACYGVEATTLARCCIRRRRGVRRSPTSGAHSPDRRARPPDRTRGYPATSAFSGASDDAPTRCRDLDDHQGIAACRSAPIEPPNAAHAGRRPGACRPAAVHEALNRDPYHGTREAGRQRRGLAHRLQLSR